MKRPILCALLLLCAGWTYAQKWDLRRCVEYAITNNVSVKLADLQTRFSALNLQQYQLSRYPNVSFQANTGYRFGLSENPTTGILESRNFMNSGYQLSTSVTLFNWFSRRFAIEASDLTVQADRAQVKKVQDDIALNVASAYLQALMAKEQVEITEIQAKQTQSQLDVTRKRVAAGALPELNAAQLEAQLAMDNSNLVTAQSNVRQLLLQLKALLNIDAGSEFDIETPPVELIPVLPLADLQPEQVYLLAVANLPQQKAAGLRILSSKRSERAARASMYPTVSAYGGLGTSFVNIRSPQSTVFVPQKNTGAKVTVNGTTYDVVAPGLDVLEYGITPYFRQLHENFGQSIGISVSVPIFNGGSLRSSWKRAQLNTEQLTLQKSLDDKTLKLDIYRAYNDAVSSAEKFNAAKKMVDATKKAQDFSQKRYDVNLLTTYELITTQSNYLRARTEMLLAQYDYVFKMKLLEFYRGEGLKF